MKESLKYLKGDFPNVHEAYHPYVDDNVYEGSIEFIERALFIAYTEGLFNKSNVMVDRFQIGGKEWVRLIHDLTGESVEYTVREYESKYKKREEANELLKEKLIEKIKNGKYK